MLRFHLEGWDVAQRCMDNSPHLTCVVATNSLGESECASAGDLRSALLELARKIHVNRDEILTLGGVQE